MDWIDVDTADEEAPSTDGIYFFAWERPDGNLLTIYIGRGFGQQGIRELVLDHIRVRAHGSECLHDVIEAAANRVLVRWDETDDEDAEALAFDEFEDWWGDGMKPPCVQRRAHARPNPGSWPASWLDDWPKTEE